MLKLDKRKEDYRNSSSFRQFCLLKPWAFVPLKWQLELASHPRSCSSYRSYTRSRDYPVGIGGPDALQSTFPGKRGQIRAAVGGTGGGMEGHKARRSPQTFRRKPAHRAGRKTGVKPSVTTSDPPRH